MADIRLNVGFPLLIRLAIKAKNELNLKVVQKVFALIKCMNISAREVDDISNPSCSFG